MRTKATRWNGRRSESMAVTSLSALGDARRVVVKVGSALLIDQGAPDRAFVASLTQDLASLRQQGVEIVLVSSGAIALGAARLGLPGNGRKTLADAQAAASVGQVALAQLWAEALGKHDIVAAQMLVTLGDLEDRRRYLNAAATLDRLVGMGALPVVNENDSVATEEIRFGDNDRLAARVAQAARADAVLLLSDVDGLYDRPPQEDGAQLVERIDGVTPEIFAMATGTSGSGLGSGGMRSKLEAARIAERAGIMLAIINGTYESPIANAVATNCGSVFLPTRGDNARKSWLGGRLAPAGVLTVDEGCVAALAGGASLLAAGLTEVEGDFARGDLVALMGPKGERLGQGLTEYSAAECRSILGLREEEQATRLGYAPRAAVVHRDHMVRQ